MLRRAVEGARAVVVHNPEAARIVDEALRPAVPTARPAGPRASPRIVEIPHLYGSPSPPPTESAAARYRQRLGVEPGVFLLGLFGYLRESKRLVPVLEVYSELRRENPRLALLVAGDFVSRDLERAVAPLLALPGVVRRPFLPEAEFWLAAAAVDACVNLRYPSAGETSGIAIRLMGLGKPVLLTDSPAQARFPEDACVRVAPGLLERESLRQHIRLLTLVTDAAAAIGRQGAAHVHERHGVERTAKQYWDLLCDCCS